jgi:hypothetical protein
MTTTVCPKGHISTEADYCSECGTKIQTTSELLAEIQTSSPTGNTVMSPSVAAVSNATIGNAAIDCPACGATHKAEDGNFCEICGYNFATGKPADLPIVTLTPPPAMTPALDPISGAPLVADPISGEPIPVGIAVSPTVVSTTGWSVTIAIDPSLGTADSPPAPNQAPIVLPLNQSTHLIGRTSSARGVTPEIPLDFDDAISHRHALLIVQPDGSLILRDIGSSNGVQYKGQDLPVMADVPIADGDMFSLGHWTMITVKKQAS